MPSATSSAPSPNDGRFSGKCCSLDELRHNAAIEFLRASDIMDDIRVRLLQVPGVEQVEIEIVWEPVWTKARLTEDGIETLRTWGVSA